MWGFLSKFVLAPLLTYVVYPLTKDLVVKLVIKIKNYYERKKAREDAEKAGKKRLEQLKKAKEEGNEEDYNTAIDDI